jgi:hypothetical protein
MYNGSYEEFRRAKNNVVQVIKMHKNENNGEVYLHNKNI